VDKAFCPSFDLRQIKGFPPPPPNSANPPLFSPPGQNIRPPHSPFFFGQKICKPLSQHLQAVVMVEPFPPPLETLSNRDHRSLAFSFFLFSESDGLLPPFFLPFDRRALLLSFGQSETPSSPFPFPPKSWLKLQPFLPPPPRISVSLTMFAAKFFLLYSTSTGMVLFFLLKNDRRIHFFWSPCPSHRPETPLFYLCFF